MTCPFSSLVFTRQKWEIIRTQRLCLGIYNGPEVVGLGRPSPGDRIRVGPPTPEYYPAVGSGGEGNSMANLKWLWGKGRPKGHIVWIWPKKCLNASYFLCQKAGGWFQERGRPRGGLIQRLLEAPGRGGGVHPCGDGFGVHSCHSYSLVLYKHLKSVAC